jgi:hypothetical protein
MYILSAIPEILLHIWVILYSLAIKVALIVQINIHLLLTLNKGTELYNN